MEHKEKIEETKQPKVIASSGSPGDPGWYLTYGCVFKMVDGNNKQFQTFHVVPQDDHLKNAQKLEKHVEHGKHVHTKHQTQLQKQETQTTQHVMTPNRFHQLEVLLFLIQTCQTRSHSHTHVLTHTLVNIYIYHCSYENMLLYHDWMW
jgi:hypothetical protein